MWGIGQTFLSNLNLIQQLWFKICNQLNPIKSNIPFYFITKYLLQFDGQSLIFCVMPPVYSLYKAAIVVGLSIEHSMHALKPRFRTIN